jgi:hypothetical protein
MEVFAFSGTFDHLGLIQLSYGLYIIMFYRILAIPNAHFLSKNPPLSIQNVLLSVQKFLSSNS